jgi:hypothetical protein
MKKLTTMLMMLGIASLVIFSSCNKDEESIDDAKVTITVRKVSGSTATIITSGATVDLTDSLFVEVKFEGNDKNKLKSYKTLGSWQTTPLKSGNLTGTSATITDGGQVGSIGTGNFTYTVILTSEKGDVTQAFSFTVAVPSTVQISTSDFILGNQADSKPKFWSGANSTTSVPARYFLSNAVGNTAIQAAIDFGYASRSVANGGNKIISPNSADATAIYADQWSSTSEKITNWSVRNNTTFILTNITSNTFLNTNADTAIAALIETARAAGEPNNQSVPALDDKVYLYKTQGGLYGLFYVASPTGSVNASGVAQAGDVTIVAKYQKLP